MLALTCGWGGPSVGSLVVSPPSFLCLAIHGPTAEAHDLHTGQPGSFEAVMRALAKARAQGRPVLVVSRLTRSSCRSLVAVAERLAAYGVAGWAIVWPGVVRPAADTSRVVPRLGIAVPHALRAVQRAQQRGISVVIAGVPSCTLGPFAAQGLRPQAEGAPGGVYPGICDRCSARSGCPGVDRWYLDRFGPEELRPVPAVPRAALEPELAAGLAAAVRASEGTPS